MRALKGRIGTHQVRKNLTYAPKERGKCQKRIPWVPALARKPLGPNGGGETQSTKRKERNEPEATAPEASGDHPVQVRPQR